MGFRRKAIFGKVLYVTERISNRWLCVSARFEVIDKECLIS